MNEFVTYTGPDVERTSSELLAKGPRSVILGGVHGDEIPGIVAVQNVIDRGLRIDNGMVHIGFGNPKAMELGTRGVNGGDLNRVFLPPDQLTRDQRQSYEFGRATSVLKPLFESSDHLLDIHSSKSEGPGWIIAEPNARHITDSLPLDVVVGGYDAQQPGGTDYYMNSIGKIGVCVESGYVGDTKTLKRASESIIVFLEATGHVDESTAKTVKRNQTHLYLFEYRRAKAPDNIVYNSYPNFTPLAPQTELGRDGDTILRTPERTVYAVSTRAGVKEPGKGMYCLADKTD